MAGTGQGEAMEPDVFRVIGVPTPGGILVVSDHASNRVPADIALGIDPALLNQHVAVDIGVAEVGALLAREPGFAAFQAGMSRLVCDVNREPDAPACIPLASDGHAIAGNALSPADRAARLARFHVPYHAALADTLDRAPPGLIVSLHSFTPRLATSDAARPWQVGVLYNTDERAARLALPLLADAGLVAGDQQPYSGKLLNYTMNRHAEAAGRAYLGVEVRQDQIGDAAGQARYARLLAGIVREVARRLAAG